MPNPRDYIGETIAVAPGATETLLSFQISPYCKKATLTSFGQEVSDSAMLQDLEWSIQINKASHRDYHQKYHEIGLVAITHRINITCYPGDWVDVIVTNTDAVDSVDCAARILAEIE